MQTFSNAQGVWAFEDDVKVIHTGSGYRFMTASGDPLTGVPSDLQPYTPPAPTPPSAAQLLAAKAQTILAGTVAIASTSTPALDGSYTITVQDQQHIAVEVQSLMLNGTFADGTASVVWPDATGTLHTFDAAQFKAFATALGAFVAACIKCQIGTSTALPSNALTIA